jgi:predicted ester cyclase
MSVESNKEALARGVDALRRGELTAWFELHDPSVVAHGLMSPDAQGLEGVKAFYTALVGAFPDLSINVHDLVGEGEDVVARFTVHGTHEGEFMGAAPTGNSVTVEGISIYRFRGGKVVERWTSADGLGLLQQIGALPAPAAA